MSSSHNERIAAKRERACLEFIETTSTNRTTAKHYLKMAAFDLERAVGLFYDGGGEIMFPEGGLEAEDQSQASSGSDNNETDNSSAAVPRNNDDDPISAIMDSIPKEKAPSSSSSSSSSFSFGGKGHSLNSNSNEKRENHNSSQEEEALPPPLKIMVVFYKDGFTAAAKEEEPQPEQKKSPFGRRGVHSISSSTSSSAEEKMRLPPLRVYDTAENKQFIKDVKESRVPEEFRKYDNKTRRPVPVSIYLHDSRPKPYPRELWEQQEQREKEQRSKRSFQGAGQTLGGADRLSGNSGGGTTLNDNNHHNFLLGWILLLWKMVWDWIHHLVRSSAMAISPPQKHTVDTQKPVTTLSLRMPTPGSNRERVQFNTDHTVQDLVRYCRFRLLSEMESDKKHAEFQIVSGFPPRPIDQNKSSISLKEAGLLNAAVEIRILGAEGKRKNY